MPQKPIKKFKRLEKPTKYRKINKKNSKQQKITKQINKNILQHYKSLAEMGDKKFK